MSTINIQPIEKAIKSDGSVLEVHSIFSTVQGEGPFCGHRAIFIRLAGCNLQCPSCDTDYTSNRDVMTVGAIEQAVLRLVSPEARDETRKGKRVVVVITGGEPFRQNIAPLANRLDRWFIVQIESNGTLPPAPGLLNSVVIVVSPKTGKLNDRMRLRANCFKYVVSADDVHPTDGLPLRALNHTASPFVARPPQGDERTVYIQPMDANDPVLNRANMQAAVNACLAHGYVLQIQVHKIIGVE